MSGSSTFRDSLRRELRRTGESMEEIAARVGVSVRTLYRHKGGQTKGGSNTMGVCLVKLVEEDLIRPDLLPAYCHDKCPVGVARKKFGLKRKMPRRERRG